MLKEKNLSTKNAILGKTVFEKNKEDTKTSPNSKQELKEFITATIALQAVLRGVFQVERLLKKNMIV